MQEQLARIALMINVVHNENMAILKMLLPEESYDKISDCFQRQIKDALNKDLRKEK